MYIVLGASGHIGAAVVETLRTANAPVTAVLHDPAKGGPARALGAQVAAVDVHDSAALRDVLSTGTRAFLLNPPADIATDTDAEELGTARAIADALPGAGLEKVVVASTYGAQPGEALGDLSVLYDFEQLVIASGIPTAINRGAYYFSNFDELIEPARKGMLPTMLPADLVLPMVAPADLGRAAAHRLLEPADDVGVRYVEGPRRYSFAEVAAVFAEVLGTPVEVKTTPREDWEQAYRKQGFSAAAARTFARMTAVTVDHPHLPDDPERGATTLEEYIRALAERG